MITMSLIKCPECGKEISIQTKGCPHCGCPVVTYITHPKGSPYEITSQRNTYSVQNKSSSIGKKSRMSIFAFILSLLGCTSIIALILAVVDLSKNDGHKKSLSIASLIICGVWLLAGIGNMVNKDTTSVPISSVEESSTFTQESITELQKTSEESSPEAAELEPAAEETQNMEENEEQEDPNPYKEAYKKGFDDHFSISNENKENLDSIKDSVDEIWNDDEVQEAYNNYKESLRNLFEK